jgi:Xaa-Pro aminopeptidase
MIDLGLTGVPTPIGDEEHSARIEAVRVSLRERGLDVLLAYGAHRDYQPADLRWLARWYCVEEETACIVVPAEGRTTLVTDASWDVERAEAEAFADDVRFGPDMGAELARLVHENAGDGARVGIAGLHFFPAPAYLKLIEALPGATFVDASELTTTLRMIKSPAELDLMRAASSISDAAMRAGLEQIRDGAAEIDVAAAAEAVIRSAGAEPSFVTEMGTGPRTAFGTFLPGFRRMADGEIAVLDCGARLHGYHGDMCRTVVVGGPSAKQRSMLEAVERSVNDAIAAMRPGVTVGHVRDIAAASIHSSGYGEYWWDAFMPHGNGAGQHEPPNAKEHPELELREGIVLCVEPGITVPGEGAIIIEQMVAVGRDHAEVLNALPTNVWEPA